MEKEIGAGADVRATAPLNGQGEIRTLDTLTGMPVFETGTFSHSVTCPKRSRKLTGYHELNQRITTLLEELAQQLRALVRAQSAEHFGPVIQLGMTHEIADRAGHA